jgi:predicted metalloprotease with PDZ domain
LLLAHWLTAAACGGAAPAPRADAGAASPGPPGVALHLEPLDAWQGGGISVRWTVTQPPREPLADPFWVAVPDVWAGRAGFSDDLRGIEVLDPDGHPLRWSMAGPDRLRIETAGHHALELRYRLRPRHRTLTETSRFRALLTPQVVFAPGHALLMQPIGAGVRALERIQLTLAAGPTPGFTLRSTLDAAHAHFAMAELVDAAFFHGHWQHHALPHVQVWVAPHVTGGAALAATVDRVCRALEPLVQPRGPTTVLVLPRDDLPDGLSGHGREGGFTLEVGRAVSPDDRRLMRLAAHEYMHRLIGHRLRFDPAEELRTLWFREGVTEYLAVRALVDSGLQPEPLFFGLLGESLTGLRASPAAQRPRSDADAWWRDLDARRLPYDWGALVAALLDLELVARHGRTVAQWIAWLRDDEAGAGLLTEDGLLRALDRFTGTSWGPWWTETTAGGWRLPVERALALAGLDVVERLEPAPWHGFRASMTADGAWYIADVDPSGPAARAGLVSGSRLAMAPVLPEGPLPHPAWVRIVERGVGRDVMVEPDFGQRRTFVLLERRGQAGHYRQAFGLAP